MNEKMMKKVAGGVKNTLDAVLKVEANTTSCAVMYQPKKPEKLAQFKKLNNENL